MGLSLKIQLAKIQSALFPLTTQQGFLFGQMGKIAFWKTVPLVIVAQKGHLVCTILFFISFKMKISFSTTKVNPNFFVC